MSQSIEGVLSKKGTETVVNEKLTKRDFVLRTDEKYKKEVCFSLVNKNTSLVDEFEIGDALKVHYNIDSREYNGKYYHNITAWKIERSDAPYSFPDKQDDLPY
jgi:hypothetical protein